MSISYPLTPPSSPIHSSLEWRLESVVVSSVNRFNLKRTTQEHAGKRWVLSVAFAPMTRAQAAPWFAFFAKLDGVRGTFLYGSYLWRTPLGLAGGTPLVKGAGQTGQSLLVDGATPSAQFLKASDMFQIDNSLYQCVNDVSANGSGEVTIDIWPNLRTHLDNAPLTIVSPKCLMRMSVAPVVRELDSRLFSIQFEAEEAL
jgi:hypothetical protein